MNGNWVGGAHFFDTWLSFPFDFTHRAEGGMGDLLGSINRRTRR